MKRPADGPTGPARSYHALGAPVKGGDPRRARKNQVNTVYGSLAESTRILRMAVAHAPGAMDELAAHLRSSAASRRFMLSMIA